MSILFEEMAAATELGGLTGELITPGAINLSVDNPTDYQLSINSSAAELSLTEPNDTFETACDLGTIEESFSLTDLNIDYSGDDDCYKFTITEDRLVTFSVTGDELTSDNCLYFYLYNDSADGFIYYDNIYDTSYSLNRFLGAGTYYIWLSGDNPTDYQLSINTSSAEIPFTEPNDTFETAYNLGTIEDSMTLDGVKIDNTEDNDYYKFTITEDSLVTVSITGTELTSDNGVYFYLYNSNSSHIFSDVAWGNSHSADCLLTAGTYYINLSGDNPTDYQLSINISAAEFSSTEPNDTFETAYNLGTIENSMTLEGEKIDYAGDNDYYKFTLSVGSLVSFETILGENRDDIVLSLYDALGKQIALDDDYANNVLQAGDYYLKVKGYGSTAFEYDLVVSSQELSSAEPNDTPETACNLGTIEDSTTLDGVKIDWHNDQDYYKFTLSEASVFSISITKSFSVNFFAAIWSDSGEQSYIKDFEFSGDSTTGELELSAGSYFLLVAADDIAEYRLELSLAARSLGEPNDTLATAYDLGTIEESVSLTDVKIDRAGDNDYYKFTITEESVVTVSVAGSELTDDNGLYFYLYNDLSGDYIFCDNIWDPTYSSDHRLAAGTYYINLSGDNRTDYQLNINISATAVDGLTGNVSGISWEKKFGCSGYAVEYSTDGFGHVLYLETEGNAVDTYNLPEGKFQWKVSSTDFGNWTEADTSILSPVQDNENAVRFVSDADGYLDVFFAGSNGQWGSEYAARHMGMVNDWEGTGEDVLLNGKNRLIHIFEGSADANILIMTDDANGDALFVDDIYTALGSHARMSRINEIRAGAGDDIVDMTSQRFAYDGDGVKIYGGLGNDTIWANNGNNTLFGDAGNDRIVGGANNDVIIGGIGNDSMLGGGGEDIFCFGANWGNDTVEQLTDGTITLWFEEGSESNWSLENRTYTDGANSVRVSGTAEVILKFGADVSLPDGCFSAAASEKVFEDKNGGILA